MSSTQQLLLGEGAGGGAVATYIEDVFSTYLYTGNGTSQSIVNGIDLSTKGGLAWIKSRSNVAQNALFDTTRGAGYKLQSDTTAAQSYNSNSLSSFDATGFTVGGGAWTGQTNWTYASWTFRKQPKFFDVVTYTGNGTAGRTVAHNLGSVPGCIIVKDTSTSALWAVYHRSLTSASYYMELNTTVGQAANSGYWNGTAPTSSVFTLGNDGDVNGSGRTYVAYLFAHDAGGFGLTGTDNVISCGTFTGNSAGDPVAVNLGYEAQWVMHKRTNGTGNWAIFDSMRGAPTDQPSQDLLANSSAAEVAGYKGGYPTSTGFVAYPEGTGSPNTYIYIAIRRGPMKVPTSGTSVFSPNAYAGGTAGTSFNLGFVPDTLLTMRRNTSNFDILQSRLTGQAYMFTNTTDAELGGQSGIPAWDANTGTTKLTTATSVTGWNGSGSTYVNEAFARAPSFFDEVCYTGTSTDPQNYSHNLQAVPEMMIVRRRNQAGNYWFVYHKNLTAGHILQLQSTASSASDTSIFTTTAPTASVFTVGGDSGVNSSAGTYVAYLFATCAGVSKVGSYTGTGTTLQVNCGFTGGARFVLIKRTDSTGDWYVWDSARGIVSGNDPYLLLNSTAAEVTNTDYVDTYSAGFEISSTAPAAINASGGTYIFLAIA